MRIKMISFDIICYKSITIAVYETTLSQLTLYLKTQTNISKLNQGTEHLSWVDWVGIDSTTTTTVTNH